MTSRLVLPTKTAAETISVTFPFLSQVPAGETISSATVTCAVYSGTDASPSSLISGSDTITGTNVIQKITGGVEGVIYYLVAEAVTSGALTLRMSAFLAVVPAVT